jgi:hypothetical protein
MKNLTKLVNGTKRAIGLGLTGAILCGTMSCATMTPAQKTALWGQGLTILGSIGPAPRGNGERIARDVLTTAGTVVTNQAGMKERLEVANAGKSEIVINNNPPNYQNQNPSNYQKNISPPSNNTSNYQRNINPPVYSNRNQNQDYTVLNNLEKEDNSTPMGLFMYKNFVDFNNNQEKNRDEFIGLNEPVYDFHNLNSLIFSFYGGDNNIFDGQSLNLKIYSMEDGKMINNFDKIYFTSELPVFKCESKYFPKSGEYKAVLNTSNNKTSSLKFRVVK